MKQARKKLISLFLAFCMTLSLLPSTAFAAVGSLLGNSAQENQALEQFTGQDGAAIQVLLEQYGLLDEQGNLVTDRTIILDGQEYTLEELEALLRDPATDLSQVGYVDGVPIALGGNSQALTDGSSATLTYDAASAGTVELTVKADSGAGTPEYAYGELAGAVQYSNAKGFVFLDGSDYADSHTVRVTYDVAAPDLSTWWEDSRNLSDDHSSYQYYDLEYRIIPSANNSSSGNGVGATYQDINTFIGLLQGANGADASPLGFTVTGECTQKNNYMAYFAPTDITLLDNSVIKQNIFFRPDPGYADDQDIAVDRTVTNLDMGSGRFNNRSTREFTLTATTKTGKNAVSHTLFVSKPFQIGSDGYTTWNTLSGEYSLLSCRVELTNDNTPPLLKSAAAPSATYRPGQLGYRWCSSSMNW